jgi:hypothetical protein
MSTVTPASRTRLVPIEEEQMQDYYPEDVPDWFERSSLARIMERRTRGITADFVLGELVRRPADPGRTVATSLARREPQEDVDPSAPGAGEWHCATHQMVPAPMKVDPAYVEHYGRREERAREFERALAESDVCPACVYHAGLQAAVDDQVGFFDRRYSGRRYRPTDNEGVLDGPQEPYPIREVDEDRYKRF